MISQITQKMNEGGAIFTYPIMAILILVTVHFIIALRKINKRHVHAEIIQNIGWLAFGWGMFGKALGFIIAFDTLKTIPFAELTAQQLAYGLRIVMLCPLFSLIVFTLCRIYASILSYAKIIKKEF